MVEGYSKVSLFPFLLLLSLFSGGAGVGLTQARRGIGNGGVDQELNFCLFHSINCLG